MIITYSIQKNLNLCFLTYKFLYWCSSNKYTKVNKMQVNIFTLKLVIFNPNFIFALAKYQNAKSEQTKILHFPKKMHF